MAQETQNKIKTSQLLLGDLILLLMISLLIALTFMIQEVLFFWIFTNFKWVGLILSFYLALCFLALIIPKVGPGVYDLKSPQVNQWFLNFIFARIWHFPLIQYPIFNSVILRTVFLKCLGCKVSFNSALSSDAGIYDPHLIEIQEDVVVGMKSILIPHYIVKGKLCLGKVIIKKGTLLGAGSEVGPGSTIEDNCKIDVRCTIMPGTTVPAGCKIKAFSIVSKNDNLTPGQIVQAYHRTEIQ